MKFPPDGLRYGSWRDWDLTERDDARKGNVMILLWSLLGIYAAGFVILLGCHVLFLHMVTPGLALARAAVWPIFWATGWPHGVPLTMD